MRKKLISIIGDACIEPNGRKYQYAFETGRALVDAGYRIATGGLDGVMAAAFHGAKTSPKYQEGDTVAVVPMFDERFADPDADVVIATGLDLFRNVIMGNSQGVVAIGGGAGTLCEIASAWAQLRMLSAFKGVDGWSSKVADTCIDYRKRYDFDDRVYGVASAQEVVRLLDERLDWYDKRYQGIKPQEKNG